MRSTVWPLRGENKVFRIEWGDAVYAFRLHRESYRTDTELRSELQWMDVLAQNGLSVPSPVPSQTGEMLHIVEGVQVDVLNWLSGSPIGNSNEPLDVPDRTGLFRRIGENMAKLHDISDAWNRPEGFVRCCWDRTGLVGEKPVWDRFWDNPGLTSYDRELLKEVRGAANATLAAVENELDYGLIHADLVRENIIIDGSALHLIDFDDGGFGFRLFEIATTLLKAQNESDYPRLRGALLEGYISVRSLDYSMLDLFILLRASTYVGWNITRMEEQSSRGRNERFIQNACRLAREYLAL